MSEFNDETTESRLCELSGYFTMIDQTKCAANRIAIWLLIFVLPNWTHSMNIVTWPKVPANR